MDYQETFIDLMFNQGIKEEADFLLEKLYCGMNNYSDLISSVKESPYTNSGAFILSELERADYLRRNAENGKILVLGEKGRLYLEKNLATKKREVIVVKIFDEPQEDVKPGKLEIELALTTAKD